jgi:hypothetical protein
MKLLTVGYLKKFLNDKKIPDDTVVCVASVDDDNCVNDRKDIYEDDLDDSGFQELGDNFIDQMKRYYKTTLQVTILSEEPYPEEYNLAQVHQDITEGEMSGEYTEISREELNGKEMAKALEDQGSDPEFFGLDSKGNEIDR